MESNWSQRAGCQSFQAWSDNDISFYQTLVCHMNRKSHTCQYFSTFTIMQYISEGLKAQYHTHCPSWSVNWEPLFCVCVLVCCPGLSQEKALAFIKRFRSEPRYLLAQNVSTCIDPLEVCLHRQTVQDTVHVFQHSIPTEGKPVTNQKNSGTYTVRENWEVKFCSWIVHLTDIR